MTAPCDARRGDRGQVTAFVVVIMTALLLCAGLVLDGGMALATRVRALDDAQAAARGGAQAIDLAAYRQSGTLSLNPAQAEILARRYLIDAGDTGTVSATATTVTVTVTAAQRTQILALAGLRTMTVSATASAQPVRGVTGADP